MGESVLAGPSFLKMGVWGGEPGEGIVRQLLNPLASWPGASCGAGVDEIRDKGWVSKTHITYCRVLSSHIQENQMISFKMC